MIIKLQKLVFIFLMGLITSACSSIGLTNPFAGSSDASIYPKDATQYLCDDNKQFNVRMLNNGNDAWLIYPDHEVNLPRLGVDSNRYASGVIALVVNGEATTLNDGEKVAFVNCKPQLKK